MGIAHLALEFGSRHQCGNRVNHEDIDRTRANQRIGDLKRLLASIRLRNQQIVDIDAKFTGIDRIECMLGIDKGAVAAFLLRLGDSMKCQCRLAG